MQKDQENPHKNLFEFAIRLHLLNILNVTFEWDKFEKRCKTPRIQLVSLYNLRKLSCSSPYLPTREKITFLLIFICCYILFASHA